MRFPFLLNWLIATLLLGANIASAQMGGGGNTGGGRGGTTGGNTSGGATNSGNTGGSFGTGGTSGVQSTGTANNFGSTGGTGSTTGNNTTGGGGANGAGNQPIDLTQNSNLNLGNEIPKLPDARNQGFIGPSAPMIIQQGFVGSATQLSGAQPAEGATFGGGVNTGGQGGGGTGQGGGATNAQGLRATGGIPGLNTGIGGGNALGGAGRSNMINRRSLRNRLVNKIELTVTQPVSVTDRFQDRLIRLPGKTGDWSGLNIALANGVATVQGQVSTAEAAEKIVRQLRLEPGVYRVDNRLNVVDR